MDVITVVAVCVISAVLARLIKQTSPEIAFAVSAAAVLVVLGALTDKLASVFSEINSLAQRAGVSQNYIAVAIKALGIGYICELCSQSCRDAGESALSSVIDLSGKIALAFISLPILTSLLEVVIKILEN